MKNSWLILFAILMFACSSPKQVVEIFRTGAQYKTFKEAIENCQDGDSIIVYPGKYLSGENIMLTANNISIVGIGKPEILCDNMQENVLWIVGDHILVKNIKASHIKPDFYANCVGNVFAIDMATDVTIENCNINGCGRIGVYISGATGVILKNNYIHNNSLCAIQINDVNLFKETDDYKENVIFIKNQMVNNGSKPEEKND